MKSKTAYTRLLTNEVAFLEFTMACSEAGVEPTKRQAMKWLRKTGAARQAQRSLRDQADMADWESIILNC